MNSEHSKISQRTGIVGLFTALSRIFGLARDVIVAWGFGATHATDAFYVAFRIPNLLRRFVAEGALTIAFVPVYTEYLKKSREDARVAASVIFTYLTMFLTLMVAVGVIFAPWIVKLIAWGFQSNPEQFDLTVYLTRLMFPYIFLISLVALAMGILNSLKRFAAPAASPIFLNIGIIAGALIFANWFDMKVVGLALGVIVGGIAQLTLQIPWLAKEGMIPRFNLDIRHPALKGLLLLMIPSAFGAAVYQVNVLIITLLASFLPEGSVTYLWYADRVSELPIGVFAISVATAVLPTLSDHAVAKDLEKLKTTLSYALRLTFAITIPAAVGLFILAAPIVNTLFIRGKFDYADGIATALALMVFAIKLPFIAGVRNIVAGFYSMKDAKTPVIISCVAVAVNVVAALALMWPFLHVGLAMALVISAFVNFVLLFIFFRKKAGLIGGKKMISSVVRSCVASAIMGAALIFVQRAFDPFTAMPSIMNVVYLAAIIAGGTLVFILALRLINREEYDAVMAIFKRRRG